MSIDRNCIEAPIAHQHKVIADLRRQLAIRADENQRLQYELRKAQGGAA